MAWMHWKCIVVAAVIGMSCAARPASAFRPFDGTDAEVAGPHLFELEMSPLSSSRMGTEWSLNAPQITLNYGTLPGFEFVLEGANVVFMNPDPEGTSRQLADVALQLKKVLRDGVLQEKKGPSFAAEGSILIPERGQAHAGVALALILSQPIERVGTMLHFNGELSQTQTQQTGRFLSLILEGPETWPVRPVAEVSWDRTGDEDAAKGVLAGVIWQTRQGLTMDLALKSVAAGDEHGVELRSGFTWHMRLNPAAIPKVLR
jgi:hypothetical protein